MRTAWALLLLLCIASTARADGESASYSMYRVAAGRDAEFAAGYARHIRWHLEARDPWAWYVWKIDSGPDRGHYMGGTFDRPWLQWDQRPRPDEDAADHKRTIDVNLAGGLPRRLVRRADLGGTLPLLETAPSLLVIEIRPAPGHRGDLEGAARTLATLAGRDARYGWYEVIAGGAPTYLLFVPLARASELGAARLQTLWRVPPSRATAAAAALTRLDAAAASIDTTLLSFRPDLSSCVRADSTCVGTVPAP